MIIVILGFIIGAIIGWKITSVFYDENVLRGIASFLFGLIGAGIGFIIAILTGAIRLWA